MTTPKPLTDAQLAALDYIVGVGGESYGGHGAFRDTTARALRRRGCVAVSPGGVVYTKWRITEKGYEERAKAHEARNGR